MEALHDVVKAGKARYIGASSMWAWQFAKMQYAADAHGWTRFVSMQDQYSLVMREEEREMFGLLADQGVGSIPFTPLAKGRLARPWGEHTQRFDTDPVGRRFDIEGDRPIVEAVQKVAKRAESRWPRSPWPGCQQPVVTAPSSVPPSRTIFPMRSQRST
jgi:aryl-alcohol dehydrogenase-like predicted oxidoreductase